MSQETEPPTPRFMLAMGGAEAVKTHIVALSRADVRTRERNDDDGRPETFTGRALCGYDSPSVWVADDLGFDGDLICRRCLRAAIAGLARESDPAAKADLQAALS